MTSEETSAYTHMDTHMHTYTHMHTCMSVVPKSHRVLVFCRNQNSLHIIMSYVLWPEIYISYVYTVLSPCCMVRCPGVTESLVLLNKNVKCPSLFKSWMLFAFENKYLQLQLATFLRKAFAVLNTILSGLMLYLQIYIDLKLLDYVHHHNWHGPMAFFNKPFRLSLSLCLSLILQRSACDYCAQVFLVLIPIKMVPTLHIQ